MCLNPPKILGGDFIDLAKKSVSAGDAASDQSDKLDKQISNLHLLAANFLEISP